MDALMQALGYRRIIPMRVTLPWPPSVNHYWRNYRGIMVISKEGRDYRQLARSIALGAGIKRMDARLGVIIDAYPPDYRKRDLDSILKALLDALKSIAYQDDSQIDRIEIRRRSIGRWPSKRGTVDVEIVNMEVDDE